MGLRGAAHMSQQNSSDKKNSDYGLSPEKMEMLLLFKRILREFVSLERHPFTKRYNNVMHHQDLTITLKSKSLKLALVTRLRGV